MPATLLDCPKCAARFPAVSERARCPHCGAEAARRPGTGTPAVETGEPPRGPSRRALLLGLGATGFLLLAGAAVVIVVALSSGQGTSGTVPEGTPRETVRADGDRPTRPAEVVHDKPDDPGTPPAKRDPFDAAPPPTSLTEAEQQEVNKAIERGLAYLKKHAPAMPMVNQRMIDLHPLVGLTLLECGVPADDIVVANLTKRVRAGAAKMTETYVLSLTILFLDRLGDPQDEPMIRHLAARLIAGQNQAGGWTYDCPPLSESDGELLLAYLDANPLPAVSAQGPALPHVVRPGEPSRAPPADTGRATKPVSRDKLPNAVKNRPVVAFDPAKPMPRHAGDDNSNTQFAVLGVWASGRHGVPVGRSVALISARFRHSQNADGSWGYNLNTATNSDSMTCAGLLGLAVGRAAGDGAEAADKDPAIARGLQFLGKKVQKPGGVKKPAKGHAVPLKIGVKANGDLYWLWSVERVGVIYSLPTIGGKDWYAWGAGLLVAAQADDGSWYGGQGHVVDTCFALLFLQRVNVAKDLTRQLRMMGRVRDPGQKDN
jgi:hypothetical protein